MGGFFKKIGEFFKKPAVYWTLIITLAVVVVAVSMYLIFGRWLDAILIAVALGVIGVLLLVLRAFMAMDTEERLARGIEEGGAPPSGSETTAPVGAEFQHAIEEIKASRLGAGGLDALPWVLMLGEPGAGKTAAMRESGLAMPAEYANRVSGAPTTSCDWWLTNDAIVLDLAGRFLALADEESEAEWKSLLRMLRKQRTGVAANGLIFAVSVESLLTRSAGELEDMARSLRRRLNEATDELGVDLPIYLVVTKMDQVEGFVEAVAASPVLRPEGALGWTNDQRIVPDPEQRVLDGMSGLINRLEGILPELILREPDLVRRRRILAFPHELGEVVAAVAGFVGRAFAQTPYDAPPYLRGVYLCSARREGATVSPQLHRLAQDWARHSLEGSLNPGGLFLNDLLHDIVIGDRELALPIDRFGKRARLALNLAVGGLVGLLVLWWVVSFGSNFMGIRRVASESRAVADGASSLAALDGLRAAVEQEAGDIRLLRRGGLGGPMEVALDRAKTTFVWGFGREFEALAKRKLSSVVTGFDAGAFEALAQLATDVTWLARRGDPEQAEQPDIAPYAPINDNATDVEAFERGYAAFTRWSSAADVQSAIDRESDAVASAAARLLELKRLEAWARGSRAYPSLTYGRFGLPGAEASETEVSGAFTRKAWEGLVVRLLEAIESTGKASDRARTFRDTYVVRYEDQWRKFMMDVPLPIGRQADVKGSPYLDFIEALYDNASVDLPRRDPEPPWIGAVREVRREAPLPSEVPKPAAEGEPPPEKPPPPPWKAYTDALALVAADTTGAMEDGEAAIALSAAIAARQPTSYQKAYKLVSGLLPDTGDTAAAEKLRKLLAMPILDASSAVMGRAFEDLDRVWRGQVVEPSKGRLTTSKMQQLYGPGGAVEQLRAGPLKPFYRNGRAVSGIGNRAMPFGPAFLRWMKSATELQRVFAGGAMGADGKAAVRLRGHPTEVTSGAPGMKVSKTVLRLRCDDGTQKFDYRQGTQSHTFRWSPDCDELYVSVHVLENGRERELTPVKEWKGPMALPSFLQAAQRKGDMLQWDLRYADDRVNVEAEFELRDGHQLLVIKHRPPPSSMTR